MKQYFSMKHVKSAIVAFFALGVLLSSLPLMGENISFKFSFATRTIQDDDINLWVNAAGDLWTDWQQSIGGDLEGGFTPLSYGSGWDIEMRIPIYAGLGLDLSGTQFSAGGEGTITLSNSDTGQNEWQSISNHVMATPIRIGFSYRYALPMLPRLSICARAGRSITFIEYQTVDRQEASFQTAGGEYIYRFEKQGTYRSEALGAYLGLGIEFDVTRFLALTAEVQQKWAKADGFKGDLSDIYTESLNGVVDTIDRSGSASLYYYQYDPAGLGRVYDYLTAEKKRPEDASFQNLRQAELNLGHFSVLFGIRFKF